MFGVSATAAQRALTPLIAVLLVQCWSVDGIVVRLGDASRDALARARLTPLLRSPPPLSAWRPTLRPSPLDAWRPALPFYPLRATPPAQKQSNVAGRPGRDYPTFGAIPQTSFSCKDQRYKGFFGDPETGCQAWHYCDFNGGQASFLCPNGTIFSQVLFTCDWWFNVDCNSTLQLYVINERLYKYIIPKAPSFPEDYHGPEVNQYLTLKFMELMQKEQKKLKEKLKNSEKNEKPTEVNSIASTISENGLSKQQVGLTNDLYSLEGIDEVPSKNIFITK
ncbi:uncharacterized protein LOC124170823 isoform X2 [Ischnura elegans]|uniref:uncharacterized protein LOC124170823 isoform X2 n=1 Tax=Ischnura elegans TaxID=197161 RepID=UPI001ED86906|nr:uncharacterized protein LOC124170823 isoform X2 [Ischnura elegans]